MRSTISGGLTYVSFAKISLGFHPCWTTFCALSGSATTATPAAPNRKRRARRFWGAKRIISTSRKGRRILPMGVGYNLGIRYALPRRCAPPLVFWLQSQCVGAASSVECAYHRSEQRRPTTRTREASDAVHGLEERGEDWRDAIRALP